MEKRTMSYICIELVQEMQYEIKYKKPDNYWGLTRSQKSANSRVKACMPLENKIQKEK